MYKRKSLSVNITVNMINQVSAALFPLITFPYVSRVLRPEGLGRVNFAAAIVQYFAILAALGNPLYGVRESAKRREDKIALSTLTVELFLLNAIMTAIVLLAFSAFMSLSRKASSDPTLFWICALPMLLTPLGFNWLFRGLEEYVYITLRTLVLRVLFLVAIFLFVRTHLDFRIYALIAALNAMGASVLNVVFVRRHISVRRVDWRKVNVWRHVRPALLTLSLSSVVTIYTSLNKVMLGYMTNDTQVGYYSVADRAVKVVVMLITSMGIVLLPRVSYYIESEKLNEYRRLMTTTMRLITFVSFPAATGLIVLANPLMLLLSGRAFEPAVPLLQIMGVDILLISLGNFVGYQVLYSQGKEKLLLYSVMFGALCNLGLNWLLIPRWYAVGAALSTLITETCVTGARIIFSRSYSNFKWPVWSMLKYATTALSMAGVVMFLRLFLAESALLLLICIGAGVTFYVMVMWLLKDNVLSAIWSRVIVRIVAKRKTAGLEI